MFFILLLTQQAKVRVSSVGCKAVKIAAVQHEFLRCMRINVWRPVIYTAPAKIF